MERDQILMTSLNPTPKPSYFFTLYLEEPKFYFLIKFVLGSDSFNFQPKKSSDLLWYVNNILESFLKDPRN